jgi:hypothetical protein
MKRFIISIAMLIAAICVTNCNKELQTPAAPEKNVTTVTIKAGKTATKTTHDEATGKSSWDAADSLSVFIRVHGTTPDEWVNYKFMCSDAANGIFTCDIEDLDETAMYDVYAQFPYYANNLDPTQTSFNVAYNTTIPDAEGGISGRSDPLWGAIENVALSDIDITMKHVATFFKFVITAEEDITVSSIKATSPENVFIGTSVLVDLTDGGEQSQGRFKYTSLTASVRNGSIAEGETGIFYFPTEAFTLASGQVLNFVLNTTDGKTLNIDITAPASGYNFEAGKVNTIARTWEAVVEDPNFTWDLSKASYSSASEDAVVWEHTIATMDVAKNHATTNANNYLPTARTSSRFYTNSILTITPGAGYSIKKIEFVATSEGYATALKNSTWTNASASVDGTLVTVTPADGTSELSALIGATCGFTLVKVFYETAALIPVTGVSLDNSSLRILKEATAQLNATIAPANASNKKVNWTSTNNSVATVSASGLVTAVAAGTATVTATTADGGFTANCTVTVYQATSYNKVTTAQSDWSGTYLIVYETGNVAFNGGLETLDAINNYISVTINNGKIEANSTTNAAAFTISAGSASGKYYIKSASGKYIGKAGTSNGLNANTSANANYDNTISFSSGNVTIAGKDGLELKYNDASNQKRFRYYGSGQKSIQLYKLGE